MTPEEVFNKVWDILVEHAGALDRGHYRETFVAAFLTAKHRAYEFRFGGHLGFGGKFWRTDNRFYVSCYHEDETPDRLAVIEATNKLLAELPYYEPPFP
jgi:hypothetical protein